MPDQFRLYQHRLRYRKILLLLVVVAFLAGVAWWSYSHGTGPLGRFKKNDDNSHKLAPAATFEVDNASLPDKWQSATSKEDPNSVTSSNISKGSNPAEACQVSVEAKKDSSAHADNADAYAQQLKDTLTQPFRSNGAYEFQDLPKQIISIKTQDGTKQVSAFYWKYKSPNNGNVNYDKVAFYVKDGEYAKITEFCAGTDFTAADKALAAMTVKFN